MFKTGVREVKKCRKNLEFCIRFNAEKKSISNPKPVKSLDSPKPVYSAVNKTRFEVPRKLGKPMNIHAEIHSMPIQEDGKLAHNLSQHSKERIT